MGALSGSNSQYIVSPPPPPSSPSAVIEATDPVKTAEELQAETRKAGLLRRSRGRLGTILSGFRGFLDTTDSTQSSGRKTLLGE